MYALRLSTITAILALKAVADPRAILQKRDAVTDCQLVLIALKASAFCSSFVPIVDVTSTSTKGGAVATVTIAGPPCTTTAPPVTTTTTSFSTSTTTTTTTTTTTSTVTGDGGGEAANKLKRAAATSAATSVAPAVASTTTKCTIKGLYVNLSLLTCDIIKQACRLYVKPKTIKATVNGSPSTTTLTTSPACQTVTPTITRTEVANTVETTTTTAVATATRQAIAACPSAPGPGGEYDYNTCRQGPSACVCTANIGQANGGAGTCTSGSGNDGEVPCQTDDDCPKARRCLGFTQGSQSPLKYYCTATQGCTPGARRNRRKYEMFNIVEYDKPSGISRKRSLIDEDVELAEKL